MIHGGSMLLWLLGLVVLRYCTVRCSVSWCCSYRLDGGTVKLGLASCLLLSLLYGCQIVIHHWLPIIDNACLQFLMQGLLHHLLPVYTLGCLCGFLFLATLFQDNFYIDLMWCGV